ncbi:MAG: hypothetical protein JJT85_02830 [Chromatiales bacterium]|nr:hypothetical protein [Chromatiales bacterium]
MIDTGFRYPAALCATAAMLLLAHAATPVLAAEPRDDRSGWYAQALLMPNWQQDDDLPGGDAELVFDNPSLALGIAAGYAYRVHGSALLLTEVEYAYRKSDISSVVGGPLDASGRSRTHSLMVNGILQLEPVGSKYGAYFGVGVGKAWTNQRLDEIRDSEDFAALPESLSTQELALQFMAGGYRYLDEFAPNVMILVGARLFGERLFFSSDDESRVHASIDLGLRYRF